MEFEGLAGIDLAFGHVETRFGEVEERHHGVNHTIDSITFCRYRDFLDDNGEYGNEFF